MSVVIPAFNEGQSLPILVSELADVAQLNNISLDVIVVDDGSVDQSWETLRELQADYPFLRGIRLRRNFGKAAALSAGFAAAQHATVFTMDGDLQDDPADIPKFLEKLDEGLDVVSGWKKVRRDRWTRVWASRIFNWLVRIITGVRLHDHNCGFKVYRREILREINLYGELHRFIPVLAAALGYRVDEVIIHHRRRGFGTSRYGLSRIPKGLLDLVTVQFLTSFRHRPQHLLGGIGLIGFGLGVAILAVLVTLWIVSRTATGWTPIHLHQRAIFYLAMTSLIVGSQFLVAGFLAELLLAFNQSRSSAHLGTIVDRIGFNSDAAFSSETQASGLAKTDASPPPVTPRDEVEPPLTPRHPDSERAH